MVSSTMNAPKALGWFVTRVRQVFVLLNPFNF